MRYIKKYETLWSRNIIEGGIYKIDQIIIMTSGVTNIPLGRIIDNVIPGSFHVKMKTYLKGSYDEFIFNDLAKRFILRKATPEEIDKFESIEQSKKYNI